MSPKKDYQKQEGKIQLALQALCRGNVPSVRQAAKIFGVPRSTLTDRSKGMPPAKECQQSMQRLCVQEELSLVRTIHQLVTWGWYLSINLLEGFATYLLKCKGDMKPLGYNWYLNFLTRHPDLHTKWSQCIDQG